MIIIIVNGTVYFLEVPNGKTFVEKPIVQVKLPDGKVEMRPAPAEAYTHVRWNFGSSVNPKTMMAASYQVRVQ
jgi:hypothetical protein